MPGPSPKPATRRQRRTRKRWGPKLVVEARETGVPEAPREFLKTTRVLWDGYWRSAVSNVVRPETDLAAIVRLFSLYDERERAYRAYRSSRLVKGSKKQPVLNPLARHMATLDARILQLEDRLGLSPKARAQLGITLKRERTLDDLNRELEAELDLVP